VTPDAAAGNDPDVDGLAAGFVACTLPREAWTHAAHLIVGMWHVDRYGADEALLRLRAGIRRLNESHGTPNSDDDGYHEPSHARTRSFCRSTALRALSR
jgi:hypothetical protein